QQFAYVASHDLKEPLRMIASYTQLLTRRYKGKLDAQADEFIEFIVDGADRMSALIEDLLAYARVGNVWQPQAVDLNEAFERAVANLNASIGEAHGSVTRGDLPVVDGDVSQLLQVLQNLIGNAIKFCSKDRAPRVHVSAQPRDGAWLVAVADNGIGIDMEHAERVFVIFQRLHGRDDYPGTGIGLAIVKKIVERHGGRIWLESKVGEGTTFFFTIPRADGAR
ncbi:GHKL domain-containing protein, partial [bacterium]|nr:GHKL domain-containing protein [bacterium]